MTIPRYTPRGKNPGEARQLAQELGLEYEGKGEAYCWGKRVYHTLSDNSRDPLVGRDLYPSTERGLFLSTGRSKPRLYKDRTYGTPGLWGSSWDHMFFRGAKDIDWSDAIHIIQYDFRHSTKSHQNPGGNESLRGVYPPGTCPVCNSDPKAKCEREVSSVCN